MTSRALPTLVVLGSMVLALGGLGARTLTTQDARRADAFQRAHALAAADIEQARARQALWLGTDALLARAGRAFELGAFHNALLFAGRARQEARLAQNQARLEAARYFLELNREALAASAIDQLSASLDRHDGLAAAGYARALGADIP
jgi:hypothetical protein